MGAKTAGIRQSVWMKMSENVSETLGRVEREEERGMEGREKAGRSRRG